MEKIFRCKRCGTDVNIDDPRVKKELWGIELHVQCPFCRAVYALEVERERCKCSSQGDNRLRARY